MAVTVPFDLCREFEVRAGAAEVFALLADVPASARHFPKVDKLVDLGGNCYRWELRQVGSGAVRLQTVYAAAYAADRKKLTVRWTPIDGVGNALIGGRWSLTRKKGSTHLLLHVRGEITVPLPGLMKRLVEPVVTRENDKLIGQYIRNLAEHFDGEL